MKNLTLTDWMIVAAVVLTVAIIFVMSDAEGAEQTCTGSWCIYEELKGRLDNADKDKNSATLLCVDIEKAIDDPEMKNARAIEALRLLAANCWTQRARDFENAAKVLLPIRDNSPKILRMWFEMEKSYLDEQTRYCGKNPGSCDSDARKEMASRYKALLKYNADLGLPYAEQIKYGISVNR